MSIVDLWNDDDLPFGGGGDDAAAESGDEDSHISDEEADEMSQDSEEEERASDQAEACADGPSITARLLRRIEAHTESFLTQLVNDGVIHKFTIPRLNGDGDDEGEDDYATQEVVLSAQSGGRMYVAMWCVLAYVHRLLREGKTANQREVYYYWKWFRNQAECNEAIICVARLLRCRRTDLGVRTSPRGAIVGRIVLETTDGGGSDPSDETDDPDQVREMSDEEGAHARGEPRAVDLAQLRDRTSGYSITNEWLLGANGAGAGGPPRVLSSDARVIVIVESEGIFARLAEDRFFERVPAVLVTGKGFPDLATRACVRALAKALPRARVLTLTDCNPHGLAIHACYKGGGATTAARGARALPRGLGAARLCATPRARWIGLRPSQLDLLALPRAAKVPLTARDRARAKSLRDSPWAAANDPEFAAELDEQLFLGYKVELEALQSLGFDFLSNEWLAERIDARDYI